MAGFRDSLREAVRKFALRTSVASLKKQGVQQVNVLGVDRIVTLIEEAVYSSLKSRLGGIEREAVAEATKAEFLRLLRSNEDLQRQKSEIQRHKERVEEELDTLRRELGLQKHALEARLEQGRVDEASRHEGEDAMIAARVRELFASLAGGAGTGVPLEARVLELVMDLVGEERRTADQARRALRDREVETLQRRIEKLNDSLNHTEHRLREVAAMKDIDDGISSVYREVQGLSPAESAHGRKRELMAAIFQANLRLQARTADKGSTGEDRNR